MENAAQSDPELLAEWLEHKREAAFRELVSRYAGLVLMTARRTCGDDSLAAEASQLTFILLARKARSLLSCASLGGWVHRAALLHSRNLLRTRLREDRKRLDLQAAMDFSHPRPDAAWTDIQPVLDDSLAALPDKDREALLLRFYRSLGVREIGAILGISTHAAQKRIDRATARLRDQLARRGCLAGTSLAVVMLAGFATDIQAAAPAAAGFASQALAAGSGTALAGSTSLTAALSMKATSVIPPLVVLLIAGVWLGGQRISMADLEKRVADLQARLAAAPGAAAPARNRIAGKTALDANPVNWKEVARQLDDDRGAGGVNRFLIPNIRLKEGFRAMSRERLLAAFEEVSAADLSDREVQILETALYDQLHVKDPGHALNRALERDQDSTTHSRFLGHWAARDLAAATAWLDRQIAAGTLEDKGLGGGNGTRIRFEREVFFETMKADPAAASERLAALPAEKRAAVFQQTFTYQRFKEVDITALADVVREQLPEEHRLDVLTWPVTESGEGGTVAYQEVEQYLAKIGASPDERAACIMGMAKRGRFPRASGDYFNVQASDLDALREWTGKLHPGLKGQVTAAALGKSLGHMPYPEAVAYALRCHTEDGGDAILQAVLNPSYVKGHEALAREVAGKVADVQTKQRLLKQLEGQ